MAALLASAVIGYLIGALPTGFMLVKVLGGVDVRTQGSGKTGATNVRRVFGWRGFFAVLVLDALKGAVAVLLARWIGGDTATWAQAAAGLASVIGHSWSVFLGFQGGRGVATGMGAALVLLPEVILVAALVAVPLVLLSRYISLGSVIGAVLAPLAALAVVVVFNRPWAYFWFCLLAAAIILMKHRDNIERLAAGTERQI